MSNQTKDKIENFYEQETYPTVERAVLAETVTSEGFKDVKGKFFLKVMTPAIETKTADSKIENGVQSSNYVELTIPAYLLLSFANPKVEPMAGHTPNDGEYDHKSESGNGCVLTLSDSNITVPKDSVFLAEFLGGNMEISSAAIIGVYSVAGGGGE